jgi:hypothetical protein
MRPQRCARRGATEIGAGSGAKIRGSVAPERTGDGGGDARAAMAGLSPDSEYAGVVRG